MEAAECFVFFPFLPSEKGIGRNYPAAVQRKTDDDMSLDRMNSLSLEKPHRGTSVYQFLRRGASPTTSSGKSISRSDRISDPPRQALRPRALPL